MQTSERAAKMFVICAMLHTRAQQSNMPFLLEEGEQEAREILPADEEPV